ncbi:hypothetical protein M948_18075 [Virgibacillus sp. CM-4]|nr:hypothetical protein [Virgibacillus sp. CM-4]EQB35013.1 hypothetical protein M948_18075 [Virgibacillus sp. CM-4]
MRNKIIDFFIGEVEEVSLSDEILFYVIMATPLIIAAIAIIIS